MAVAPVPFSGPDWLVFVYVHVRQMIDNPAVFPWARLALDSDWQHLQACVEMGLSPYVSWPEAITALYDSIVLSGPMVLAFPGAHTATLTP